MSNSTTVKKGFELHLQVNEIGSIKPTASGTFSDRNGRQIKYNGSVSFKVINTEMVEDEILGEKEVDTIIDLKIPCLHDSDIKPLNEYIRVLKQGNVVFNVPISIPRSVDATTSKATCLLDSKAFILMMEKQMKKQADQKK